MTVERYNTPNHPRWSSLTNPSRTNSSQTNDAPATGSQRSNGRTRSQRDERRPGGTPRSAPLLSRDETGDETAIELRNTPERLWITAELPDRSLDDVHVSVSGVSIRIQSDATPRMDGLDRTITLAEPVDLAELVTVYDEPALHVVVPYENQ